MLFTVYSNDDSYDFTFSLKDSLHSLFFDVERKRTKWCNNTFFSVVAHSPSSYIILAQKQRRSMDVNKTSSTKTLEKRYAELAEKTSAAITSEGPPPAVNNGPTVQPSLPKLPRYQPPPPPPPIEERHMRVCRMFFPTSGHMGFDKVKLSDELPPIEIVREMILYETRLRLSDSVQDIMDENHTDESAVT